MGGENERTLAVAVVGPFCDMNRKAFEVRSKAASWLIDCHGDFASIYIS